MKSPGSVVFAVLLFSFGYIGIQIALASEHRLLSIENELAVARDIQASILPGSSPELKKLRVAAAYRPMTAVAGDFYEFISVDPDRTGFLVADVTGHGVPAALIAAMIKWPCNRSYPTRTTRQSESHPLHPAA
jgi:phosphoserine phosphatase RsbU/P